MSDYGKIKNTPEYADAIRDFENRVRNKLDPAFIQLAEIRGVIDKLEDRVKELEGRLDKAKL